MLARIRKAQDNDESGFTLIELLVVIIIIGILAAIAIPTFLKQREKGWLAAVKSDVKNAITAEESYGTDNNGSYTEDLGVLGTEGYNASDKVDLTVVVSDSTSGATDAVFTICGVHENLGTSKSVGYNSETGQTTVYSNGTCT
jgi:type IV pilus assembly protein PilA